jgi:hypothetical protein
MAYNEFVAGGLPMRAKETVRELLDRLPDDCSLDDVLYHLYVVQTIQQGRSEADAGHLISHAQVAEALWQKWQLGVGQ